MCQVLQTFLHVVFKVPHKGMAKSTGSGENWVQIGLYHILPKWPLASDLIYPWLICKLEQEYPTSKLVMRLNNVY